MNTDEPTQTTTEAETIRLDKKRDAKPVVIPVRHMLSDAEIRVLSERGVAVARSITTTQRDFDSLKADYKFRITNLETERERLDEKIEQGFEMRDTACTVTFNEPDKGKKTTRRDDTGEVVCVEQMSPFDLERELPLKDEKKDTKVLPDNPSELVPVDAATITPSEPLGTSVGNALDKAAAGTSQPLILIPGFEASDWEPKGLRAAFKSNAKAAGWPKAAIAALYETIKTQEDVEAIKATLRPHIKAAEPVAPEPPGIPTLDPLEGPIVDGQIHTIWGFLPVLSVKPITPENDAQEINNRIHNAAVVANWPELARQSLDEALNGMDRDELVELANRLTGGVK